MFAYSEYLSNFACKTLSIMKKVLSCLFFCLVMVGCGRVSGFQNQLKFVESLIEDYPDSAWIILQDIPVSLLRDGEELAWYKLLLTEADYKLYKPFKNDTLINYSIRYYQQTKNEHRLATAYYYKGAINNEELKNKDTAIVYLKKAEELSRKGYDELLKSKIYEELRYVNAQINSNQFAFHYSKLFLSCSKKIGRPNYLACAYNNMATDYNRLGNTQAAKAYRDSSLFYIDKCDKWEKVRIFNNYANDLMKKKEYSLAKEYLKKCIQLDPRPNHYYMLGKIAKQEGDTLQARLNWEKAVSFKEPSFLIKAYKDLSRMYIEREDYLQALIMLAKADSVNVTYQEQMRTSELTEIQHRYDRAIVENTLMERKNFWLTIAFIALVVLVVAMLIIFYFIRRTKAFKGIIDQNIEQIYQNERRIEELQLQGKESEQEVITLQSQIDSMTAATAQKLGRGKDVYETIKKGERVKDFSKNKEHNFVDFYAYTYSKKFHDMVHIYPSLTLRLTTYLILRQMKLTDRDIQNILNVSDSTIRSYRYRLKIS